jgi:hypothetical protein
MAAHANDSGINTTDGPIVDRVGGDWIMQLGGLTNNGQVPYTNNLAGNVVNNQQGWTGFDTTALSTYYLNPSQYKDFTAYMNMMVWNDCAKSPIGCPPGLRKPDLKPTQIVTPPPSTCQAPEVLPGSISATSALLAPKNPVVVGQDPSRRGLDLFFTLTIAPTTYHFWKWEVVSTQKLCNLDGVTLENCPAANIVDHDNYDCIMHTQQYCESANLATASMNLTPTSRDWIQNDLGAIYPGAYIHHPNWSFTGNKGGCSGVTFIWRLTQTHIQAEDPGYYSLSVSGRTNGTPVSPPRSFAVPAGQVGVYLIQTTIIK